jgi:hypothetical protein
LGDERDELFVLLVASDQGFTIGNETDFKGD